MHPGTITAILLLLFCETTLVYAQETSSNEWDALTQEFMDLYRQGSYDRAAAVAKKALEVAEQNFGPYHPAVATSLTSLAEVYRAQRDYIKAVPLYKRVLDIVENAYGPTHPNVAIILNDVADLHRAQGDYAKAAPPYKRSLDIREKTLGSDHPDVATALNNLAGLHRAQGDYVNGSLKLTPFDLIPAVQN